MVRLLTRISILSLLASGLTVVAAACTDDNDASGGGATSGTTSGSGGTSAETGTTSGSGGTSAETGPRCCPPGPLGCCMRFGGWDETGRCSESCDGMALPTDSAWTKKRDARGCEYWSNPFSFFGPDGYGAYDPNHPRCGGASPSLGEAGADAAADSADSANGD
jgi:hypothetical protein